MLWLERKADTLPTEENCSKWPLATMFGLTRLIVGLFARSGPDLCLSDSGWSDALRDALSEMASGEQILIN